MKAISRRRFLKLAGQAAVGVGAASLSPAIGLASLGPGLKVAQATRMMMGTFVSITVVDTSTTRAQEAMEAAFERMKELVPIYDRHGKGLVHELNTTGSLELTPELASLLGFCTEVHRLTGGAFDITVAPLVDLVATSFATRSAPPTHEQLEQALRLVGALKVQGRRAWLTAEGAGITLDGVAKGHLADEAIKVLKAYRVKGGLVNAGGDIAATGSRGGRPWRIGISDPNNPSRAIAVISLREGAVATSGNYEVYYDRDKLFHHIINPRTGRPARADASVSVRAHSAVMADALSTACFVMAPHEARKFLSSHSGISGLIITRHGMRYMSGPFKG